jgi:hypothetical protein
VQFLCDMDIHIELTNGMRRQIYELCTSEKFDTTYFSGDKALSFFNLVLDVLHTVHAANPCWWLGLCLQLHIVGSWFSLHFSNFSFDLSCILSQAKVELTNGIDTTSVCCILNHVAFWWDIHNLVFLDWVSKFSFQSHWSYCSFINSIYQPQLYIV